MRKAQIGRIFVKLNKKFVLFALFATFVLKILNLEKAMKQSDYRLMFVQLPMINLFQRVNLEYPLTNDNKSVEPCSV
jgi:hypothetical protein